MDRNANSPAAASSSKKEKGASGYTFEQMLELKRQGDEAKARLEQWDRLKERINTDIAAREDLPPLPTPSTGGLDVKTKAAGESADESVQSECMRNNYPGEMVFTFTNSKSNLEFVGSADDPMGMYFCAMAFATSWRESYRIKTQLLRDLRLTRPESKTDDSTGEKSAEQQTTSAAPLIRNFRYQWRPALNQFLGVLQAAFGADLEKIFPGLQGEKIKQKATEYGQRYFKWSNANAELSENAVQTKLENLEAVFEILTRIDWQAIMPTIDELISWLRIFLSISLDVTCRTMVDLHLSIRDCIKKIVTAASKINDHWPKFCQSVQLMITGDFNQRRHHHDMVHLCLQLPVGTTKFIKLRASVVLGCISVLLGRSHAYDGTIPTFVADFIEKVKIANENDQKIPDAYTLSSFLRLINLVVVPEVVEASPEANLDHLRSMFNMLGRRGGSDVWKICSDLTLGLIDNMYVKQEALCVIACVTAYGEFTSLYYFPVAVKKDADAIEEDSGQSTCDNEQMNEVVDYDYYPLDVVPPKIMAYDTDSSDDHDGAAGGDGGEDEDEDHGGE